MWKFKRHYYYVTKSTTNGDVVVTTVATIPQIVMPVFLREVGNIWKILIVVIFEIATAIIFLPLHTEPTW